MKNPQKIFAIFTILTDLSHDCLLENLEDLRGTKLDPNSENRKYDLMKRLQ
jgi:hypothetical protein